MPRKKSTQATPPAARPPVPKRMFTMQEAADTLSISLRTVQRLVALRKLGAIKIGSAVRIPDYEIERLIAEGTDRWFADVYGRQP